MYLGLNFLLSVGPMAVFFAEVKPHQIKKWPEDNDSFNQMFKIAWNFTWITNFLVYGIGLILGGTAFFEESLLTGGYIAWT